MLCSNWKYNNSDNENPLIVKENGKRILHTQIRLFEEEITFVNFLCFYYDLSYEQLLIKLAKKEAESIVEG